MKTKSIILISLLALVAFIWGGSSMLFPGRSAAIVHSITGLDIVPVATHQIYVGLGILWSKLLPGDAASNLNWLSAFFGALCLFLFGWLIQQLPVQFVEQERVSTKLLDQSHMVASLSAVLLLAVSIPFWRTATEPSNILFDVAWLLVSIAIPVYVLQSNRGDVWLYIAAFLYGIGVTGYSSMIVLLPLFLFQLLVVWIVREAKVPVKKIGFTALFLGLGVCFYFLWALLVGMPHGFKEAGFENYWEVLLSIWVRQFGELRSSLGALGALLVLLYSYVPWLYVILLARTKKSDHPATIFLKIFSLLVLLGVGFAILLNVNVSPEQMYGKTLIIPYMSICGWMGLLLGFLWLRIRMAARKQLLAKIVHAVLLIFLISSPGIIAYANRNTYRPADQKQIVKMAENITASIEEDIHLFFSIGSPLDDLIEIMMHREDRPFYLIPSRRLGEKYFLYYLAREFPECAIDPETSYEPRDLVRLLAENNRFGMTGIGFSHPELCQSAGFSSLTHGMMVLPVMDLDTINPEQFYQQNRAFYEDVFAPHIQALQSKPDTNRVRNAMLRDYSRCANNTGAVLLGMDERSRAESMFNLALSVYTENPSVHLNLREIYAARFKETGDEAWEKKAAEALNRANEAADKNVSMSANPVVMSVYFGQIFSEKVALQSARFYRSVGQEQMAEKSLEIAAMMNPGSDSVAFERAQAAMASGQLQQGADLYQSLLEENPELVGARLGYATALYGLGRLNEASRILAEPTADVQDLRLKGLLAVISADAGEKAQAEQYLNELIKADSAEPLVQSYIAMAAVRLKNRDVAERYALRVLDKQPGHEGMMRVLLGLAKQRSDLGMANDLLMKIKAVNPDKIKILQEIIVLNMGGRNRDRSEMAANELVNLDEGNFVANMALADISREEGRLYAEEEYLRAAMTWTNHPGYHVLVNNLAYNQVQQKQYEEAVELARQAVRLAPSEDTAHHTLAAALKGEGNLVEAQEEIMLAQVIDPENSKHKLLQAEILLEQGENEEAVRLAQEAISGLEEDWRRRAKAVINTMP